MKTAYILIGVPASGKTHWMYTKNITTPMSNHSQIISTDMHIEMYAASVGATYSQVFDEYIMTATSEMMDDLEYAKHYGFDIMWDQTNVSVKSRSKKLRLLDSYHKIAVVFKTPNQEELTRRLNSRPGKNIPYHVMKSMIDNFEYPTLDEGFDEIIEAENM